MVSKDYPGRFSVFFCDILKRYGLGADYGFPVRTAFFPKTLILEGTTDRRAENPLRSVPFFQNPGTRISRRPKSSTNLRSINEKKPPVRTPRKNPAFAKRRGTDWIPAMRSRSVPFSILPLCSALRIRGFRIIKYNCDISVVDSCASHFPLNHHGNTPCVYDKIMVEFCYQRKEVRYAHH